MSNELHGRNKAGIIRLWQVPEDSGNGTVLTLLAVNNEGGDVTISDPEEAMTLATHLMAWSIAESHRRWFARMQNQLS